MTLDDVMAVTLCYFFGTRPYFFHSKHCHRPVSRDEERRPVALFMGESIVFLVRVRCRRKESLFRYLI